MSEHDDGNEHAHEHAQITIMPAPISSAAATRRAPASSARTSRTPPSTLAPPIASSTWTRSIRRLSTAICRIAALASQIPASEQLHGRARCGRAVVRQACAGREAGAAPRRHSHPEGRVHVVPSTKETVRLGVYDANLPPILTIDSGDTISSPTPGRIFSMKCSLACRSTR